jgi:hypothetical protein
MFAPYGNTGAGNRRNIKSPESMQFILIWPVRTTIFIGDQHLSIDFNSDDPERKSVHIGFPV